ncbi:hypothetical protein HYDPIDRAFT_177191 [Hydnomerulius pinastri MD-312]|uniref:Helitron helicase-like domain-containing protein n=1 Tax=Hydnomerulius pinastri MD-312 TaxID=994086 RepID=A0A0C9V5V5_9AGAM|nr:hypothetical protein HYDPIDRAFT_177191 [Hydnomerulius pinastri MD-312]
MYHDKHFQRDELFPLIAFNHEQIKRSSTSSFLMTNRNSFTSVANHILNIDPSALDSLISRLQSGAPTAPHNESEKACYQLIKDLNLIGKDVQGSVTAKKHMHNEIWSLISSKGAPTWYITLSPSDERHPICLYYADLQEHFKPEIKTQQVRHLLNSQNPMAGARFFHLMVSLFIKHVLGAPLSTGHKLPSYYNSAQYNRGFYEQQGRLTLHLHMLL